MKKQKQQITADNISDMLSAGHLERKYYEPSNSNEYFDGEFFYNASGQQLRDPSEYDKNTEGYTPFGDE